MLRELKHGAINNPIWFGAVATITGVQSFFAWEFWGAISQEPTHQFALRALGVGFVAGEVVALDMASRADLNNEPNRASLLRTLWGVLALTTFSADISALATVLREGDGPRASLAAAFDANQTRLTNLETRIDKADDPFNNELLSVSAYDAAIAGKEQEMATARASRRTTRLLQLQDQMTALQTARAASAEVAGWKIQLEAARQAPESHAQRPATGAVEFQPFAEMATGVARTAQNTFGFEPTATVTPEDVRGSMAWVATIAMKLMLTFGVWVGLQRGRAIGIDREQSPEIEQSLLLEKPVHRPALTAPDSRPAPRRPAAKKHGHKRFGRG